MKKYLTFLLVVLVTLFGCAAPPAPAVTLQSPGNGSTVSSLTPTLAWSCTEVDASYELQMATDSSFQNLVVDEIAVSGPSYSTPPGKLTDGQSYFWRLSANKVGQSPG